MITAKIIADSVTQRGHRIATFELVFPRHILAELNTHRVFSKNSASSRAIPAKKMIESVKTNPFMPIAWQKEHSGMQGVEYHTDPDRIRILEAQWKVAMDSAIANAETLLALQVTKQITNRLLEPFMYHKVLLTTTELDNFFNLRCPKYTSDKGEVFKSRKDFIAAKDCVEEGFHYPCSDLGWRNINKSGAEIHMQALAEAMWDAYNESEPFTLMAGEWHIPYFPLLTEVLEAFPYIPTSGAGIPDADLVSFVSQQQIKVSCARCARLSYQTLGDNPKIDLVKDVELYTTLLGSGHMSPFEHCAKVPTDEEYYHAVRGYAPTNTMYDTPKWAELDYGWFNNFHGWVQYRHMLGK